MSFGLWTLCQNYQKIFPSFFCHLVILVEETAGCKLVAWIGKWAGAHFTSSSTSSVRWWWWWWWWWRWHWRRWWWYDDGGKRQNLALSSPFSDFSSRNLHFPWSSWCRPPVHPSCTFLLSRSTGSPLHWITRRAYLQEGGESLFTRTRTSHRRTNLAGETSVALGARALFNPRNVGSLLAIDVQDIKQSLGNCHKIRLRIPTCPPALPVSSCICSTVTSTRPSERCWALINSWIITKSTLLCLSGASS